MTLRANKNGTWVGGDDQSAGTTVYGKLGTNWLYAKAVFANKNGVWTRAWTDCRLFDAGGRDWSDPTTVVTTAGSCSTRTQTTTVTRTKTGCPNDVRATTVAAPDCTGCTGTPYVSNACDGCGSITTTPGTGGCPDTTSGSCGTWDSYLVFESPTPLSVGPYPYATWLFAFGEWVYTDSAGDPNVFCAVGVSVGLLGPERVEKCSISNTYRPAGADGCRF
jgi:hypothetical protein